jgi:hypothetical protein
MVSPIYSLQCVALLLNVCDRDIKADAHRNFLLMQTVPRVLYLHKKRKGSLLKWHLVGVKGGGGAVLLRSQECGRRDFSLPHAFGC